MARPPAFRLASRPTPAKVVRRGAQARRWTNPTNHSLTLALAGLKPQSRWCEPSARASGNEAPANEPASDYWSVASAD